MTDVKIPPNPEPYFDFLTGDGNPFYSAAQMDARYLQGYEDARAAFEHPASTSLETRAAEAGWVSVRETVADMLECYIECIKTGGCKAGGVDFFAAFHYIPAIEEVIAEIRPPQQEAQTTSADPVLALAKFGAKMLRAHRGYQACEVGDIDGGSAQEAAVECGVLESRTVLEPCGVSCVCGWFANFPLECYSIPEDVFVQIASFEAHATQETAQPDEQTKDAP